MARLREGLQIVAAVRHIVRNQVTRSQRRLHRGFHRTRRLLQRADGTALKGEAQADEYEDDASNHGASLMQFVFWLNRLGEGDDEHLPAAAGRVA
ncbi:MAG: hypothetical protein J0L57_00535 [Burkholderiales bacterium]|nr:hypothetical protein [Burkholderiales bacterium]